MTIRKGEDWGTIGRLPIGAPIVSTDRALAMLFSVRANEGLVTIEGPSHVGLSVARGEAGASDLGRTVGARSTAEQIRADDRPNLPIDLAVISIDGQSSVMTASLVIRRRFWVDVVAAAMNASFLGDWNVTPSGHPNDGRLDVVHAELGLADRLKARHRLPAGTHLPHPEIAVRRLKEAQFTPHGRAVVWIDGHRYGAARHVDVTVFPDATTIVI